MIAITLPLKIISEANARSHWRVKADRVRFHRRVACNVLGAKIGHAPPAGRLRITLTRIAPRKLDDDNLAGGFKAVRDGVADWLGVDDGHPTLTWVYAQRKGDPREYAATVEIEEAS